MTVYIINGVVDRIAKHGRCHAVMRDADLQSSMTRGRSQAAVQESDDAVISIQYTSTSIRHFNISPLYITYLHGKELRDHEKLCNLCNSLHWLPVHSRINFKSATFTYKSLHSQSPGYLASRLHHYIPTRNFWNKLPIDVKSACSISSFTNPP